ncbi:T9SS type A sorting domain-containing protein, partial [bacterium]|nr:T9SS type A sorting domain-containing protein [bacterium]
PEETVTTQPITLRAGWNLISSHQFPQDNHISAIVSSLSGNLIIMKNGAGAVYYPELGIDQILTWNTSQGYLVYVSDSANVEITGTTLNPQENPIDLRTGWNMVSYLLIVSQSTVQALSSIQNELVIAKNGQGQVYWPAYQINTIGDMRPGQGYSLYVLSATTLTYPAGALARGSIPSWRLPASCVHFHLEARGNGSSAVFLWRELPFPSGDEIAAFAADGEMVGSGVVENGQLLLTVWGKDPFPATKDGAMEGERLALRHWSRRHDTEAALQPSRITDGLTGRAIAGRLLYQNNSVLLLTGIENTDHGLQPAFHLAQNHPNPFNDETVIEYFLPQDENMVAEIMDLTGKRVRLLQKEFVPAGWHRMQWDGRSDNGTPVPTGLYIIQCKSGNQLRTMKATLLK